MLTVSNYQCVFPVIGFIKKESKEEYKEYTSFNFLNLVRSEQLRELSVTEKLARVGGFFLSIPYIVDIY